MSETRSVVAVPPVLQRRLWYALGGAALFFVVSTIQGMVRPDFDAWHQSVSALSLGPGGWLQQLNLIVFGAVLLTTVPVWRAMLAGGKGSTAFPIATAISAVALIVLGVVPQDPAPGYDPAGLGLEAPTVRGLVHLAVAGIGVAASAIGLFIMATRFDGDSHWRGWPLFSRVMAFLTIACVVVYAVWSTQSSGLAGSFERAAILVTPVWGFLFLLRLRAGTPFMARPETAPAGERPGRAA